MEDLTIVVGGQAGSEGKGAITARLHREVEYQYAVRVGGPNAGHTVIGDNGKRYPLRQLPVAAVADRGCNLVIAAGSEIDPAVLRAEIGLVENDGYAVEHRLFVDKEATVVESRHAEAEAAISTGTTGKGIGAARADRAMRSAIRASAVLGSVRTVDTQDLLREEMRMGMRVMIEGTQGYWLGSHAGYYPYCTSGDCRASDFLAAAGLPPQPADVWLVLRTHPIRIAGESGPLPFETSWDAVGVAPEITTVTKKVRRVGGWNWRWAEEACKANAAPGRHCSIALTFADYWWHSLRNRDGWMDRNSLTTDELACIDEIEGRLEGRIGMLGTGPNSQILLTGVQKGAPA